MSTLVSNSRNLQKLNHLLRRKERLYRFIYKFTQDKCELCASTGCKCSDRICSHVETCAQQKGLKFPHGAHTFRFIGLNGCVVPPQHRETCTLYLCDYAQKKPGFPKTYYDKILRISQKLEMKIMEIEFLVGKQEY